MLNKYCSKISKEKFGEKQFYKVMFFFKYTFLIFTIILFVSGIFVYAKKTNPAKNYPNKFNIEYCDSNMENEIKRMFSIKYDHYLNLSESLGSIQKGIIALSVIAILILVFGANKLPFFGFSIPDKLLYLIVYFGGLYLLANFGLTLNALIENRLSLHKYIDCIEILKGTSGYKNSLRHVLSDSTFGDNWFGHYFGIFDDGISGVGKFISEALGWFGLYGIYAVLIGLYHGFILTSTVEFLKRNKINMLTSFFMLFFMLIMFISMASSYIFKMVYPIFWIASIYLVLSSWLFFWHLYGQYIYDKNKINSENSKKLK